MATTSLGLGGGAHIAAACGDGAVRVWPFGDETWSRTLNEQAGRSWAVAVTDVGDRVAASSADGHVRVWNLPAGELVWDVDAKAGRIRSLAFDGAGTTLAAACGDGTARLWDATGSLLDEIPAVGGWSRAVALDERGTRVAVGAGTGMITVRAVATGSIVAELPGHAGRILQLGFFGDRLLSAGADGTVRLWSLIEQQTVAQVRVDASGQCAGFDAASGKVVVASAAGVTSLTSRPWARIETMPPTNESLTAAAPPIVSNEPDSFSWGVLHRRHPALSGSPLPHRVKLVSSTLSTTRF